MNTYRPSPALDLQEFIRQAEPGWKAAGYKPLPFGSVALLLAIPQHWDWPEVTPEQALADLLDVQDALTQTMALVDERIRSLRGEQQGPPP
jgi:hypothetical protein